MIHISNLSNSELLKYISENGILDLEHLQDEIEMNKRKELLKKHPYEIWLGSDGYYHTYIPDKQNGRIHRKRSTKEKIENVIVEYWKAEIENPTIKDIYDQWINGKLEREEIQTATKNRYDRQFNSSMVEFGQLRIKSIDLYDIEKFVLDTIHDKHLTVKGYSNLRTILRGIFRLAKKKRLIDFSISEVLSDIEISRKTFRRIKKEDEELVFTEDDMLKLKKFYDGIEKNVVDYGILLTFKTGLRPGELAGLQWCDVDGNIIHVHRTEIRFEDDSGKIIYEVRDYPKTEAGIRNVVVPDEAMWILKEIRKINPFGKFVFEENGIRKKIPSFDRRIRTVCEKAGIVQKSMNKIRKTYCTMLIDAKVDNAVIISQVGHTDIRTTMEYYYKNRKSESRKIEAINKVFSQIDCQVS